MSLDPATALFSLGKSLLERVWPDPAQQATALHQLEALRQKGDLAELEAHVQLMVAQVRVNEASAQHKSLFVAGARPAAIWAGVFALAWSGVGHPMLMWAWAFLEMTGSPPPMIDSSAIVGIVSGLLGVSGMRSFDKRHGTQTDHL